MNEKERNKRPKRCFRPRARKGKGEKQGLGKQIDYPIGKERCPISRLTY